MSTLFDHRQSDSEGRQSLFSPQPPRHPSSSHPEYPPNPLIPADSLTISTSRQRLGFFGWHAVPSIFVILLTGGLGTVLLLWLIFHQVPSLSAWERGAFIVDEGTKSEGGIDVAEMKGLTISSFSSSIIAMASPFIMSLMGFRVASKWLSAELLNDRGKDEGTEPPSAPTPLQYGLLARLIGGSGLTSIYETGRYLARSKKRRAQAPSYLREAFIITLSIFVLVQAVTYVDIWLHTAAHAALIPLTQSLNASTNINYSIKFNQTICDNWLYYDGGRPCMAGRDTWASVPIRQQGQLVAANASEHTRVITLSESQDAAIVVPALIPQDVSFTAETFGARAVCNSLNAKCQKEGTGMVVNCTTVGYPQPPFSYGPGALRSSEVIGLSQGILVGMSGYGNYDNGENGWTPQNPATILLQLRWTSTSAAAEEQVNDVLDLDDMPNISVYVACSLLIFNGTVEYTSTPGGGNYKLISETPSNDRFYGVMWGPLMWQHATQRLVNNIQGAAMTKPSVEPIVALINQELSRLTLAYVAGTLLPAPASNLKYVRPTLLGEYPFAAVFTYIALLYTFTAIALFVYISSSLSSSYIIDVPASLSKTHKPIQLSALKLAEAWLTSPLPLISALFPTKESTHRDYNNRFSATGATECLDMFVDTPQTERVAIGLGPYGDPLPRYGVWRRPIRAQESGGASDPFLPEGGDDVSYNKEERVVYGQTA